MTRIIAVANQKGGVGKTTTAINLSTAVAALGYRVLLLDLDPQGNASTGLGVALPDRRYTSYDLLMGSGGDVEVANTVVPGLSLIPATPDLSSADLDMADDPRRIHKIKDALAAPSSAWSDVDFVFIDCPPSLSLLTINALVAADAVLVPLQCEFYALEGLSHLIRTIERVKRAFNPGLDIHGVVLTMFDKRNNLSDMVAADVRGFFGEKVYDTVIPRNVKVSEAPSHGKPVLIYDLRCPGSQAYIHLASEVLKREKKRLIA